MTPESRELALAWLAKSESDLATARILITGAEKHFDTGSFHCQQAVEKALKSWLTAQEIIFPKTHSLEDLLRLCLTSCPAMSRFEQHCRELTPLAQEFRYPGDRAEPNERQSQHALTLAQEVCAFCRDRMAEIT